MQAMREQLQEHQRKLELVAAELKEAKEMLSNKHPKSISDLLNDKLLVNTNITRELQDLSVLTTLTPIASDP